MWTKRRRVASASALVIRRSSSSLHRTFFSATSISLLTTSRYFALRWTPRPLELVKDRPHWGHGKPSGGDCSTGGGALDEAAASVVSAEPARSGGRQLMPPLLVVGTARNDEGKRAENPSAPVLSRSCDSLPVGRSEALDWQQEVEAFVAEDLQEALILGVPWLQGTNVNCDFERKCVHFGTVTRHRIYWVRPTPSINAPATPIKELVTNSFPPEYHDQFQKLVQDFQEVFRKPSTPTKTAQYVIRLSKNEPFCLQPYRYSEEKKRLIQNQIEEMLTDKIIEPSQSTYNSPVVIVNKKSGDLRFCVDFRCLNSITHDEVSPLPAIHETLKAIEKSSIFSTIDLKSGYWQIPMHPESRHLTAFTAPDGGKFQFLVMPFGLKGTPATFQRTMGQEVLTGYLRKFCLVYLDDIIVLSSHGKTISSISAVCSRDCNNIISLALLKNVCLDPERLLTWATPYQLKGTRHFLAIWGKSTKHQFQRHNFQLLLRTYLAQEECGVGVRHVNNLSNTLKALCSSHFAYTDRILVRRSSYKQMPANKEPPPSFIRKDQMIRQPHYYLKNSLLLSNTVLEPATNYLPDALSRLPAEEPLPPDSHDVSRLLPPSNRPPGIVQVRLETLRDEIRREQGTDPATIQIRQRCTFLEENPVGHTQDGTAFLQRYQVRDDILWEKKENTWLMIVPTSLQPQLIYKYHDEAGHPDIQETVRQISQFYKWTNLKSDISSYIRQCRICQCSKNQRVTQAPLRPRQPLTPWDTIALDLMGPYPRTSRGRKFILVVTDLFCRWVEAFPISSATTAVITRLLEQEVMQRFGYPRAILTDNGSQFTSRQWQAACIKWKAHHWTTAIYHPRANPTERRKQEIKTGLRIYLQQGEHRTWDTHLSKILFDQRGRRNAATGTTPYYALFGRSLLKPGEWNNNPDDVDPVTYQERVENIRRHQYHYLQPRVTAEPREPQRYEPGKLVYCKEHPLSNKENQFHAGFASRWSGPYPIQGYAGGNTYWVEEENRLVKVHHEQLRPVLHPPE
ncbi:uncharacterized protein LOC112905482 [Agrilus planipennis]|uniref:RNA-directed DNA polymerase n=1 Tax=Agrilus planipennis TaxID=224129 RepID=A0A7F5RCZ5_AGRPL|nr:uncharacterized protein LOC112905482 [Agrilus planipennis]